MQSACAVLYCYKWALRLYHIFPHYLINGAIFGKKLLNIKCVFWFCLQILSQTFLILRRIQRDIIINVHRSSCKVPLLLLDFNETRILSTGFRKILKYRISKTDMTQLILAFLNFANTPKNRTSDEVRHKIP
jgi:hypothetical protein